MVWFAFVNSANIMTGRSIVFSNSMLARWVASVVKNTANGIVASSVNRFTRVEIGEVDIIKPVPKCAPKYSSMVLVYRVVLVKNGRRMVNSSIRHFMVSVSVVLQWFVPESGMWRSVGYVVYSVVMLSYI